MSSYCCLNGNAATLGSVATLAARPESSAAESAVEDGVVALVISEQRPPTPPRHRRTWRRAVRRALSKRRANIHVHEEGNETDKSESDQTQSSSSSSCVSGTSLALSQCCSKQRHRCRRQSSRSSTVDDSDASTDSYGQPRPRQKIRVHSQLALEHRLIPNMSDIISLPCYWGVMGQQEAERMLSDTPDGTFILRDSVHNDFLFTVSFRRYKQTLHVRVEINKGGFSFSSHDPELHSTETLPELLEYYRHPANCLFFEPLLLKPKPRNFCFSLQSMARAAISDCVTYDGISKLPIPYNLKEYMRTYHCKQPIALKKVYGFL